MLKKFIDAPSTPEHEKMFGGFNDFPPNWHEITTEEFAQSDFFSYSPEFVEHRQMFNKEDRSKPVITGNLHFFHGGHGYCIVAHYWEKTIRYFKFFHCKHENAKDTSRFMHEHRTECLDCGRIFTVDSSD